MLKIVYPICCGVDVHKRFIVATIASTNDENITSYLTKRFDTYTEDLVTFKDWLLEHNCKDVCMESTGKYYIPVYNILEDYVHVTVANPKYVKAIRGKKTDKKDSIWIADLFKHDLVPGSYIPPKPIRMLRELFRYRFKLVNNRTSERNRLQNCLTVSNIQLASVLTDMAGKSAQAIINYITTCEIFDPEYCKSLLQKSAKKKADDVIKSIVGYSISNEQSTKIDVCTKHQNDLDTHIKAIQDKLYELAKPYEKQVNHICTCPGFRKDSAIYTIAEIGVDMTAFKSAKHLCSWAGLTPQNNESAGKKKSVHISRAGVYLKPLLVECANNAIKDKNNTYFKVKYDRIKKRRGHKRAIVAIARMMLTCVYHMLLKDEDFNPCDFNYSDIPEEVLENHKQKYIDNAIFLLQKQGFTITKDDVIYATN